MRWPFFGGNRADRPISIDLPVDISPAFAVLFRAGDGTLDFISGSCDAGELSLFRGQGRGKFAAPGAE
jgi:hypothetical protein